MQDYRNKLYCIDACFLDIYFVDTWKEFVIFSPKQNEFFETKTLKYLMSMCLHIYKVATCLMSQFRPPGFDIIVVTVYRDEAVSIPLVYIFT